MIKVKVGSDDKAAICKALLPVLQGTRDLYDLIDLEYEDKEDCHVEIVTATFKGGGIKRVNVTLDSGTQMILDVIHGIR